MRSRLEPRRVVFLRYIAARDARAPHGGAVQLIGRRYSVETARKSPFR